MGNGKPAVETPPQVYDIKEWLVKPKNPDGLKGSPNKCYADDKDLSDLEKIAKEKMPGGAPPDGWKILTRYNWDTDVAEQVNYYLHSHCKCKDADVTEEGNYVFSNSLRQPGNANPSNRTEWVWYPGPQQPSKQSSATVVPHTRQCNLDTPPCDDEDIEVNPHTCELKKETEKPDCKWPDLVTITTVPLTHYNKAHHFVTEVQDLQHVYLHFFERNIHMAKVEGHDHTLPNPNQYEATPSAKVTTLIINFDAERTSETIAKAPTNIKRGRSQGPPKAASGSNSAWLDAGGAIGKYNLGQLRGVAEHLRDLQHAGVLKRVVVRGFTDRTECADLAASRELSKERAQWVFEELKGRFGLKLIDEKNVTKQSETLGFVPTRVVPCGRRFTPKDCSDRSEYRLVLVEWEKKEQEPAKDGAKSSRVWYCCSVYEFKDKTKLWAHKIRLGDDGEPADLTGDEKMLIGRGTDEERVQAFRNEALACIDLLESIVGTGISSKSEELNGIKEWILQWRADSAGKYPMLTDVYAYWDTKIEAMNTHFDWGWVSKEKPSDAPPWIVFVGRTSRPPANHLTTELYTAVVGSSDIARVSKLTQPVEETLDVPPLTIYFNPPRP